MVAPGKQWTGANCVDAPAAESAEYSALAVPKNDLPSASQRLRLNVPGNDPALEPDIELPFTVALNVVPPLLVRLSCAPLSEPLTKLAPPRAPGWSPHKPSQRVITLSHEPPTDEPFCVRRKVSV